MNHFQSATERVIRPTPPMPSVMVPMRASRIFSPNACPVLHKYSTLPVAFLHFPFLAIARSIAAFPTARKADISWANSTRHIHVLTRDPS